MNTVFLFLVLIIASACGNKADIDYGNNVNKNNITTRKVVYQTGGQAGSVSYTVQIKSKSVIASEYVSDVGGKSCKISNFVSWSEYSELIDLIDGAETYTASANCGSTCLSDITTEQLAVFDLDDNSREIGFGQGDAKTIFKNPEPIVKKINYFIDRLKNNFNCDGTPKKYNLKTLRFTSDSGVDLMDDFAIKNNLTESKKMDWTVAVVLNDFNEPILRASGYLTTRAFDGKGMASTKSFTNIELKTVSVSDLMAININHNVIMCLVATPTWIKDAGTVTLNYESSSLSGSFGCGAANRADDPQGAIEKIKNEIAKFK